MEATAELNPDNILPLPSTEPKADDDALWVKTPVANLYKYAPAGTYFCKAKVNGRLVRRKLGTKSFEIAKIKLDQLLSRERGRVCVKKDEDLLFADLVNHYLVLMDNKPIEDSSKLYRKETIKQIRNTWPGIDKLRPRDFTELALFDWATIRLREKYRGTRYNGAVQTMCGILQIAVDRGILLTNPAFTRKRNSTKGIPLDPVPVIPPTILTKEQFKSLLEALDNNPSRRRAAMVVRFLAYSGQRIGASRRVYPEDVDLEHNEIVIRKDKRSPNPRRVPMIPEMRAFIEQLIRDHPGVGPLLEIKSPRKALKNACKEIGIEPPITPHDLRHLFATQAIEQGVDQRTLGELLGHKDGGKLAFRVYAHVRRAHAQATSAKICFDAEKAVDQPPQEPVSWEI